MTPERSKKSIGFGLRCFLREGAPRLPCRVGLIVICKHKKGNNVNPLIPASLPKYFVSPKNIR